MLLACGFITAVSPLHARLAYAVELISFTAFGMPDAVELRWETATELGAAAFQLQRGQGANFVNLTQLVDENGLPYAGGIIEAEGSPTFGATYIARDLTAVSNQTYTYQLIEIESDNNSTVIASVTVVAGATATPTQITLGNNTPVPGNQSSSTPTAVATIAALATTPGTQASATATRPIILMTPTAADASSSLGQATVPSAGSITNNSSDGSAPLLIPSPTSGSITEIAQIQATPESAYPAQITPPETETGYPEAIVTPLTIPTTVTSYPANGPTGFLPEQQPTPTIIGVVGSQTNGTVPVASTNQFQTAPDSSIAVLWLGFLAGLLIFVTAVAGSIVIFVRRRQ